MKSLIYLGILNFVFISCAGQYAVEDELYAYMEQEFASNSLSLPEELDSLESLFLNEGIIESISPEDYRNYYQKNINQGRFRELSVPYRVNNDLSEMSFDKLRSYALKKFGGETYKQSKFGRISNIIDTSVHSTEQITFVTVAQAHLEILSTEDFEHPFYRANVLLSLQWIYFNHYLRHEKYIREIPKKIEKIQPPL